MKKKIVAIMMSFAVLFAVNLPALAETVSWNGGTAFTNSQTLSTVHNTYYVKLEGGSYNGLPGVAFPGAYNVNARIRKSSNNALAGDMASFTAKGQSTYKNYWYPYGGPDNYKLAVDSDGSLAMTVSLDWNP